MPDQSLQKHTGRERKVEEYAWSIFRQVRNSALLLSEAPPTGPAEPLTFGWAPTE
jgi:hypothetical protein